MFEKNKQENSKEEGKISKGENIGDSKLKENADLSSNNTLLQTKISENVTKMNINIAQSDMETNNNNIINSNNILLKSNSVNKNIKEDKTDNSLNKNDSNEFPFSQQIKQFFSKQNIINALIDQNKTICLQNQLRTISKNDIYYIIDQLHDNFREIMKDKNVNYFCSDLFKECDQEQRIKILKELSPTLADDCLNQTLIEKASSEFKYKLILSSFNDYNKLLYVSLDQCGEYTV